MLLHVVKLLLKFLYIFICSSINLFDVIFTIIVLYIDFVRDLLSAFDTFLDNVSTRGAGNHVSTRQKLDIRFVV